MERSIYRHSQVRAIIYAKERNWTGWLEASGH
jgi:hypothetical protein